MTETIEAKKELREIDCRIDIFQLLDTMADDRQIDKQSAEELKKHLQDLNGTALYTVYLRWVEGYKTQKEIAARLGLNESSVTKAQKKLRRLRAEIVFTRWLDDREAWRLGLDPWEQLKDDTDPGGGDYWKGTSPQMNAKKDADSSWAQRDIEEIRARSNDIVWEDRNREDDKPNDPSNTGHVVKQRIYERDAERSRWPGQTNPTVEPSTKNQDDQQADFIKARRAEERADRLARERAERIAARDVLTQLEQASPAKIAKMERRQAAEEIKRNL